MKKKELFFWLSVFFIVIIFLVMKFWVCCPACGSCALCNNITPMEGTCLDHKFMTMIILWLISFVFLILYFKTKN